MYQITFNKLIKQLAENNSKVMKKKKLAISLPWKTMLL